MNLVEKIVNNIDALPPFPAVIQQALQLIDDPKSSAQDVVNVIQYDQAITANVLKVCNSAYFSLRRPVNSLREALVMIGFNQLLEIIMSQRAAQFFSRPCQGYGLEAGELWRHSVVCALLSQVVAKRLKRAISPTHFTAALLHDIGKILLNEYIQTHVKDIQEGVQTRMLSFSEGEKEVLGIDHAELGGLIMEKWKFPKTIVSAVRYHHTPFAAPEDHDTVFLIYLCDLVAIITGFGGGVDGLSYHAYEEIIKQYGLEKRDIEQFISEIDSRFQQVEGMLGIN
jgi:putative nucleotidyltransferase with HDIG domain